LNSLFTLFRFEKEVLASDNEAKSSNSNLPLTKGTKQDG